MLAENADVDLLNPPAPATLEQAGLNADFVQQLLLKTMYFGGALTGSEMSKRSVSRSP